MLRRTKADQVLPVYRRFVSEFPTLKAFSTAGPRKLRHLLSSLGLQWRIENFVQLSRLARQRRLRKLPDYDGLTELPGVGLYVASAVECFARREALPVIDANVVRVLGRYFGFASKGEVRRNREFIRLAGECVDENNPREYNMALLDLGAAICTATKPNCLNCPLRTGCAYRACQRTKRKT